MLSPLRSRTYRHLFAAQVIALLGIGLSGDIGGAGHKRHGDPSTRSPTFRNRGKIPGQPAFQAG